MAAVWLARQHGQHGFSRLVAVKTILPQFAGQTEFHDMFLDEARIASRIAHPNVVEILDLGEHNDILYQVMEWIDGDSLIRLERGRTKRGERLPQRILLRILSDACLGLHAAHELRDDEGKLLNVVHRDVSPQNMLVTTNGVTKLIDFGIAKARARLTRETTAGMVKGKLAYMAPEQALAMPVDRRADIWAIGAIFYRVLSGKPPYAASNPMAVMEVLRSGRLPQPLPKEGIHPAVRIVMEGALSPAVNGRFATALELREAMEEAMEASGECATQAELAAFVATHLDQRQSVVRLRAAQSPSDNATLRMRAKRPRLVIAEESLPGTAVSPKQEDLGPGGPAALESLIVPAGPPPATTDPPLAVKRWLWLPIAAAIATVAAGALSAGPLARRLPAAQAAIGLHPAMEAPATTATTTPSTTTTPSVSKVAPPGAQADGAERRESNASLGAPVASAALPAARPAPGPSAIKRGGPPVRDGDGI